MKTVQQIVMAIGMVAFLAASGAQAIKVYQDLNMQGSNVINAGGNNITNVKAATEGDMVVILSQLTNTSGNVYNSLNGMSNYIENTMITNVANYNYLTGQVDETYVNVNGDTMTGPLVINNNLTVSGTIKAGNIYAETTTVMNIVVSNTALFATNLTLQGVLDMSGYQVTNLGAATRSDMAVNFAQFTNGLGGSSIDLAGATNQVLIDARGYTKSYTDSATNQVLIDARSYTKSYTDSATNQVQIDARSYTKSYTDNATNQVQIDARQYTKSYTDNATNQLLITADGRYVNVTGDAMTGDLNMGGHNISNVNFMNVKDLVVENETVANITVTNYTMLLSNITMRGVLNMSGYQITNLADATRGDMAVTYRQLTNTSSGISGNLTMATNQVLIDARSYTVSYTDAATNALNLSLDLQQAYKNGNTITSSAGEGNVVVAGTQKLDVQATGGVTVSGGDLAVNSKKNVVVNGGQVQFGGTANTIGTNGVGKLVVYSGGAVALEFE